MELEKSAEVIVPIGKRAPKAGEASQDREGLNIELCPNSDRNVGYAGIA
ncbi:hypothetical protein IMPERIA75_20047 [Imperialibacter sp. 75]|nr:hypothetical protein IMPERIA75_20047 [Imperialibacter sp. 75]